MQKLWQIGHVVCLERTAIHIGERSLLDLLLFQLPRQKFCRPATDFYAPEVIIDQAVWS
jgi:hypothetical protein